MTVRQLPSRQPSIDLRQAKIRLIAACVLLWQTSVGAGEITRPLVVRFNTVCASCHEGECSGRLSFESGASAAHGHMQRYLGPLEAAEATALFSLLRYTKERCAYYPVPAPVPPDGVWPASELAAWRNPQGGSYFIPLGELPAGNHRLRLRFSEAMPGRLKITNQHFEPVLEESLCPQSEQQVSFSVASGAHYLTLHGTAQLDGLSLEAADH